MVYGVVKQSGGYIGADSEVGKAPTFKIYLPQVAETAETGVSKKPQQHRKQGSETILLVEDDAAVRDLVSAMLTAQGYTVLVRNKRRMRERFANGIPGAFTCLSRIWFCRG